MEKTPPAFTEGVWYFTPELAGLGLCQTLALGALAGKFASAAHSFRLLAGLLFRRLFEMRAGFHLPEEALALHFLLQRAKGLFDIVVADDDLYDGQISIGSPGFAQYNSGV